MREVVEEVDCTMYIPPGQIHSYGRVSIVEESERRRLDRRRREGEERRVEEAFSAYNIAIVGIRSPLIIENIEDGIYVSYHYQTLTGLTRFEKYNE